MSEPRNPAWPPPVIESFSLETSPPSEAPQEGFPQPIARVIVRGRNFFIRAIPPRIEIGGSRILDFEILPDEQTLVLFLFQRPPDGGRITVSYGPGLAAESEQPFVWS